MILHPHFTYLAKLVQSLKAKLYILSTSNGFLTLLLIDLLNFGLLRLTKTKMNNAGTSLEGFLTTLYLTENEDTIQRVAKSVAPLL